MGGFLAWLLSVVVMPLSIALFLYALRRWSETSDEEEKQLARKRSWRQEELDDLSPGEELEDSFSLASSSSSYSPVSRRHGRRKPSAVEDGSLVMIKPIDASAKGRCGQVMRMWRKTQHGVQVPGVLVEWEDGDLDWVASSDMTMGTLEDGRKVALVPEAVVTVTKVEDGVVGGLYK